MKFILSITCVSALIVFAIISGCAGIKDDIDANTDAIAACKSCHSDGTDTGEQILGAQAQYAASGHYKGPRMFDPNVANTGHIYVFHGSNAPYANRSSCAACHTHEGFVTSSAGGTVEGDATPAPPGCFTCHKPHTDGDFSLRTTTAVTLTDTTTSFNLGTGNLCATCHLARDNAAQEIDATDYTIKVGPGASPIAGVASDTVSSHWGPHHGPQADVLMGVSNWDSGTATIGVSKHATGNSCVACHHYQTTGGLSGNLEWGGHGFYLTSDVHGAEKDLLKNCSATGCHSTAKFEKDTTVVGTPERFVWMNKTAAADWDGNGTTERVLVEIRLMRDKLIAYYGTGTNFIERTPDPVADPQTYTYADGAAGDGALIEPLAGGDVAASVTDLDNLYKFGLEYAFQETEMSLQQAYSFFNLKLFIEDKSDGIHNPTFAAQILWDAINNLNQAPLSAGIQLGATRP
jgi:hypothetical protein